jgi:hypothetical protein
LNIEHCNPGSAVKKIDEMRSLFTDVHTAHMDVICVSESWFKSHHSYKLVNLPGYRLLRAIRRDGRRGDGAAIYVGSGLQYKVSARSMPL